MFKRALKADVSASADLADDVATLMRTALLSTLPLLRKAGGLVAGGGKVDGAVRSGEALLVLHAREAASDGVRKIEQARHAVEREGGPTIPAERMFSEEELSRAFGGDRVIHAAVLRMGAGEAFAKRLREFQLYCNNGENSGDERRAGAKSDGARPT